MQWLSLAIKRCYLSHPFPSKCIKFQRRLSKLPNPSWFIVTKAIVAERKKKKEAKNRKKRIGEKGRKTNGKTPSPAPYSNCRSGAESVVPPRSWNPQREPLSTSPIPLSTEGVPGLYTWPRLVKGLPQLKL